MSEVFDRYKERLFFSYLRARDILYRSRFLTSSWFSLWSELYVSCYVCEIDRFCLTFFLVVELFIILVFFFEIFLILRRRFRFKKNREGEQNFKNDLKKMSRLPQNVRIVVAGEGKTHTHTHFPIVSYSPFQIQPK